MFLNAELRKNNGKDGAAMYIAVKGDVFDVGSHPSGREMYGQESPYRVFVGRYVLQYLHHVLHSHHPACCCAPVMLVSVWQ